MHQYGVRDVEKLLGLPRSTIRALINAGFVSPARGARNAWQFSFQDLIVLRTAQALSAANVPHRRIVKSLKELRKHLPDSMPMSGLRIGAVADHIVVSEAGARWQAETGQYLLAFEGDPEGGSLSVIDRTNEPRMGNERGWFDRAVSLEQNNVDAAIGAYEKAIAADPDHLDAHVNLGRLLHEAERYAHAERIYRDALKIAGGDSLILFNLAVLYEDMDRKVDAVAAYETALRIAPDFADAHFNLALLFEQLEKPQEAIRHMSQYRRLVGKP